MRTILALLFLLGLIYSQNILVPIDKLEYTTITDGDSSVINVSTRDFNYIYPTHTMHYVIMNITNAAALPKTVIPPVVSDIVGMSYQNTTFYEATSVTIYAEDNFDFIQYYYNITFTPVVLADVVMGTSSGTYVWGIQSGTFEDGQADAGINYGGVDYETQTIANAIPVDGGVIDDVTPG